MAKFRISKNKESTPESISLMFRDLKRDPSIKFLWEHQGKILDTYQKKHLDDKNVAIELPTGTGKTLVGLLIAEYRRKSLQERVVILCPTRQLCIQVREKAKLYGINTALLIGSQKDYNNTEFYNYQQAKAIAITTYSGIFNSNPKINDPNTIICDDAHAADNYVASLWTVSINRKDHEQLFNALARILESFMSEDIAYYINNTGTNIDRKKVDLISTIACFEKHQQIIETTGGLINQYSEKDTNYKSLQYSWNFLSTHLDACSIYYSSEIFEIRPIIPPTLTHKPFADAKQRIYMSATLGEDGDLERIFGVKKINKLPIPDEWHKRSTGRRLIFLPSMSDNIKPEEVVSKILEKVDRGLILVPDNNSIKSWSNNLKDNNQILNAEDIEDSLEPFTKSNNTLLILASRYDGIDLPGEDCRFVVIEGMPSGSGLQEKYLATRLGVSSQLRNRIRTRITQAMGRCTRDESDYAIVILLGDDLTKWCCTQTNTQGMHPELQAEIAFGISNSTDDLDNSEKLTSDDFVELSEMFLKKLSDWDEAEKDIRERRDSFSKISDNVAKALAKSMPHEIDYIYKSWNGEYEEALNSTTKILDALESGSELKPYVSFWYHQAAISAFLAWKQSHGENFRSSAITNLKGALSTSQGVKWLNKLFSQLEETIEEPDNLPWQEWFLEINNLLQEWGIQGSKYSEKVASVEEQINNIDATEFEKGLALLGKMLGAKTHKWNDKKEQGKPDGLWIFGDWQAFVFEAKTEEGKTEKTANYGISLGSVTQAGRHEQTARTDKLLPNFVPCSTIVISPRKKLHENAIHHTKDMTYLSHQDVIDLFNKTASALQKVRSSASKNTEEGLKEYALKVYKESLIGIQDIKNLLLKQKLAELPKTK